MRNKIFILTEDLQFFYRINKELNQLKIKSKILNFWNKIPNISSVILTTSKEIEKIKNIDEKITKILPFSEKDSLEGYILKVLAAYRRGIERNYSELIFSIDPGTIHYGLVIFLDGFFIYSSTFNKKENLIKKVKDFSDSLQESTKELISIKIKIGSGVINTAPDLLKTIQSLFDYKREIKIFLVNEDKTSKINIYFDKRRFPKHEASALIIALRSGIILSDNNLNKTIKQPKLVNTRNDDPEKNRIEKSQERKSIREIGEKLLRGELSLSQSIALLQEKNSLKDYKSNS